MTVNSYADISTKKDALLRKALTGGVHVADYSATAPTLATLFDATTGHLCALPTGFSDLGYMDPSGAKFARAVKTSDITSWGAIGFTRSDVTQDETSVTFIPQETNLHTIALFYGVAESTISTTPTVNGAMQISKPALPPAVYKRVIVIGADEDNDGETIVARFLPRCKVTAYADQVYDNAATPISYGVTLTGYLDDVLGYSEAAFFGGPGWLAKLTAAGFTAG